MPWDVPLCFKLFYKCKLLLTLYVRDDISIIISHYRPQATKCSFNDFPSNCQLIHHLCSSASLYKLLLSHFPSLALSSRIGILDVTRQMLEDQKQLLQTYHLNKRIRGQLTLTQYFLQQLRQAPEVIQPFG